MIEGKIENDYCYVILKWINGVTLEKFMKSLENFKLKEDTRTLNLFVKILLDILDALKGLES